MTLLEMFLAEVKAKGGKGRIREETNTSVSVATTGTQLLNPNPNRISVYIENQDGTNFAKTRPRVPLAASSDAGARLTAAGGYVAEDYETIGDAIAAPWFAVADTAATTVLVLAYEAY